MKTIAHLVNLYLRNSETFIYDQINCSKAFNNIVLCRETDNLEKFPANEIYSIKNSFFEKVKYTIFKNTKYFEDVLTNKKAELIHAHYGIEGVYALSLKEKLNLPLITSIYGHDITRLPKFTIEHPSWFIYWLNFNNLKNKCDLFLSYSLFFTSKLEALGVNRNKIKTHYIGIKVRNYDCKPDYSSKAITTAGRLVEKKGTEYLIKAFSLTLKKYPAAKLVIIGDGYLKNRLIKLTNELKISTNVFFVGWKNRDDVIKTMIGSSIFAMPSVTASDGDSEGVPSVIKEAMSLGLPIIGTYHAGIPEAVINGENGFLVPERDTNALAEKIDTLFSNPHLCETFGNRGKEIVSEKFNLDTQILKLENIYKDFI